MSGWCVTGECVKPIPSFANKKKLVNLQIGRGEEIRDKR